MVDGEAVLSCLLPVANVAGRSVRRSRAGTTTRCAHLPRALRRPVRLLRARDADGRAGAARSQPVAVARGDRRGDRRQRLPLRATSRSSTLEIAARPAAQAASHGPMTHMTLSAAVPRDRARGRAPRRLGHVTGTTEYVDDVRYPGMLHLKMVRNPLVHARIRGIDLSEAEKVPGFVRALTAADVPKNVYTILCLIGVEPDEERVLAEERAATAASRSWRWSPRPRRRRSRRSSASARPRGAARRLRRRGGAEARRPAGHALGHEPLLVRGHHCRRVRYGDAAAARAGADHVIEGTYQTSPDRARADRDHRLHRQARGRRPDHRPHQHTGALLLARQHGDHPARSSRRGCTSSAARWAAGSAARSTSSPSRSRAWRRSRPAVRSATSTRARRRCACRRRGRATGSASSTA